MITNQNICQKLRILTWLCVSLLTHHSWHITLDIVLLACHSWYVSWLFTLNSTLLPSSCHPWVVTLNFSILTHTSLFVTFYMLLWTYSLLTCHSWNVTLGLSPVDLSQDLTGQYGTYVNDLCGNLGRFCNCQKPNSTKSKVRFDTKITLHPTTTTTANSMSTISQLILTRCWWNFKGSFLGSSRTDSNYQVDICPGNICPGNICPGNICPGNIGPGNICSYLEYLSCYWPDLDKTLN